jgi:hypothetical protein
MSPQYTIYKLKNPDTFEEWRSQLHAILLLTDPDAWDTVALSADALKERDLPPRDYDRSAKVALGWMLLTMEPSKRGSYRHSKNPNELMRLLFSHFSARFTVWGSFEDFIGEAEA